MSAARHWRWRATWTPRISQVNGFLQESGRAIAPPVRDNFSVRTGKESVLCGTTGQRDVPPLGVGSTLLLCCSSNTAKRAAKYPPFWSRRSSGTYILDIRPSRYNAFSQPNLSRNNSEKSQKFIPPLEMANYLVQPNYLPSN
jgi:hypothetical protein